MEMTVGNSPNNPHDLNIHGFPATKPVDSTYDKWVDYAKKRIKTIESSNSDKQRMKISEFLSAPQFAESQLNNGSVEGLEIKDKFNDPLPSYPFDATGGKLIDSGLKRSVDYLKTRVKRREWGFREKILQGYPEYRPFFSNQSKYIVGIVTAGSGVFSGIPSPSNIKYSQTEVYRSAEIGISGATESPITPTGLCFIQDETGGMGIALGSDIRYMFHPTMHQQNYSNPYIIYDDMHAGSIVIPKADYRQFLRVGDLVVIEVGTNFKYWHAVLGSEPRYWEELWVPPNMVVKRRFKGDSDIEYYVEGGNLNFNRNPGQDRKPYVDNWGAYERPSQNLDFVSPTQRGRDVPPKGIWGNTYANYPIQEDHPWTTGTPIPVNTGMPYIMMEQFMVDETERFLPTPLVITNSQLRGFPNPDDWRSIIKGFDTPKKLGLVNPELAWYKETSENPRFNPWITDSSNPKDLRGSDFKGMLVQLKDVEFVLPPKKPQLRVKLAPKSKISEDRNPNLSKKENIIRIINANSFPFYLLESIATILGITVDIPDETLLDEYPTDRKIFFDMLSSAKKAIIDEILKIKTDSDPKIISIWNQLKSSNLTETTTSQVTKTIENLTADLDSIYALLKAGVALGNIEVLIGGSKLKNANSIGELELLTFLKNKIDSRGFYFDFNDALIKEWLDREETIGEYLADLGLNILFAVIDSYTFPGFSSTVYSLISTEFDTEDWDDEEDGDRNNYYQYEFVNLESPFPKSVDKEDGGYWWANPDIPLTNARSHWKDTKEYNNTGPLSIGFSPDDRIMWTQRISSNKFSSMGITDIKERRVRDLGMTYSSSYAPFAEEWKPSTIINGQLVMNKFEPIPSGSYFVGNRTYYVRDKNNVVVPIRINSNTEIARFEVPIPTGSVDITGIAWQYSLGKPGLEWEREAYMMQIWPRFASDIAKKITTVKEEDKRGDKKEEKKEDVQRKPTPPTRLPDKTLNLGDAIPLRDINRLDCDVLNGFLQSNNQTIRRTNSTEPLLGCEGLQPGQEMYIIVESDVWYGLTRTFYFKKDKDGNCTCLLVPKGTNKNVVI